MLIIQYIIAFLYPLLKLIATGLVCWVFIKNRSSYALWMSLAMIAAVLVDAVGLLFATEVYVVESGRAAKTLAYDAQRVLYTVHYLLFAVGAYLLLRKEGE